MKISFLLLIIGALILSAPRIVFAAPVGNPMDVPTPRGKGIVEIEQLNLKVSFDTDLIFEKDIDASESNVRDAKVEGQWYLAKISVALIDRFEPYVLLGASDIEGEYVGVSSGSKYDIEGDTNFAWGVGSKILIWETEDLGFAVSGAGEYRRTDPGIKEQLVDGVSQDATDRVFEIEEWQFALAVSKEFKIGQDIALIPYVGAKYSDSEIKLKYKTGGTLNDLGGGENADNVGVFVGVDLSVLESLSINVEGRFIDETAMSIGATVKF